MRVKSTEQIRAAIAEEREILDVVEKIANALEDLPEERREAIFTLIATAVETNTLHLLRTK